VEGVLLVCFVEPVREVLVRAADPCAVLLQEPGALVLHMGSQRIELRRVLTSVVCAEEQFATRHEDAHIRLRAAAVAAVGCGQGLSLHCRVHKYM